MIGLTLILYLIGRPGCNCNTTLEMSLMASNLTRADPGLGIILGHKITNHVKNEPISDVKLPDSLRVAFSVSVLFSLDITRPLVEGEQLTGVRE